MVIVTIITLRRSGECATSVRLVSVCALAITVRRVAARSGFDWLAQCGCHATAEFLDRLTSQVVALTSMENSIYRTVLTVS